MTIIGFAVYVIPDAHKNAINRVFNIIEDDEGNNVAQPANATGEISEAEEYPYWYGGRNVGAAWLALYQNLAARIDDDTVLPSGGWPYSGVTKIEAIAAAEALNITAVTGNGTLAPQALKTALNSLSIKEIDFD